MLEVLTLLVRANVIGALAVLVVMIARLPVRRVFGAQIAYQLWLIAPLVLCASLVPAIEAASESQAIAITAAFAALLPSPLEGLRNLFTASELTWVWAGGVALALGLMALSQRRFLRFEKMGRAGPALVGVICPRIVTPRGYAEQFSDPERALVRAHERAHIDRGDPKINAAMALAQCLFWFNPLVHLATRLVRIDQELACDAVVINSRPGSRRLYAQTLLKTQMATAIPPLGCHWAAHPLEARIRMLGVSRPSVRRHRAGIGGISALGLTLAIGAWAAQPLSPPHRAPFVPLAQRQVFAFEGRPAIVMISLSAEEVRALPHPQNP